MVQTFIPRHFSDDTPEFPQQPSITWWERAGANLTAIPAAAQHLGSCSTVQHLQTCCSNTGRALRSISLILGKKPNKPASSPVPSIPTPTEVTVCKQMRIQCSFANTWLRLCLNTGRSPLSQEVSLPSNCLYFFSIFFGPTSVCISLTSIFSLLLTVSSLFFFNCHPYSWQNSF